MYVTIDVDQMSEKDQFRLLCHLKEKFESRKVTFLDQQLDEHYSYLSSRTVAFLKELKVERTKSLLGLSRRELVKKASKSVVDELDQFLGCYGWALAK